MVWAAASTLFVLLSPATVFGDEVAFVDVDADNSMTIRSLDVVVSTNRGLDNFFASDPMDSHDWAQTRSLSSALAAELYAAADSASVAGKRIREHEQALEPIFKTLPKLVNGRVNKGTARYALNRYFSQRFGWTMKGLQPAGQLWLQSLQVTQDVRQVSKFIVPTLLYDMVLKLRNLPGNGGVDLHLLAVLATTFDHLVRSEMLSLLYSTYFLLGLTVAGRKSSAEVDDVLNVVILVYAFGLNLEVSSLDDMNRARNYLEAHHSGWPLLRDLATRARANGEAASAERRASAVAGLDFLEVLGVVEDFQSQYGPFHARDCARAKAQLEKMPDRVDGAVPLSSVRPLSEPGFRPLFTESSETLRLLGVLTEAGKNESQLIAPNYLYSQAFCLSTASYYTVCCPNECEAILARLESALASDEASPQRIVEALVGEERLQGGGVSAALVADLEGLAKAHEGVVSIHGSMFASWLHRTFPMDCAKPNKATVETNPRTADEWISDPSPQGDQTDEIMAEIATFISRYATMGTDSDELKKRIAEMNSWVKSSDEARPLERVGLDFAADWDERLDGEAFQSIDSAEETNLYTGVSLATTFMRWVRPFFFLLMLLSGLRFAHSLLRGAAAPFAAKNVKDMKEALEAFA